MRARIVTSVAEIDPAGWERCYPGEAENHAYYLACERAARSHESSLSFGAACVEDAAGVVAVAPFFLFDYRLDTPLQGSLRRLSDTLYRTMPGLLSMRALCVGSPYAERCHAGMAPDLSVPLAAQAGAALRAEIERHGRDCKADVVAWKDLAPPEDAAFASGFNADGYGRLGSLPVAVLDLPFTDEAGYLASLSASTRKDIRRKLAKAGAVRIEMRHDIAGIEAAIAELYESTRLNSGLDYGDLEALPPGYFGAVADALGERAVFVLYWVGSTLAAFNLLLVETDRVIDKFLGMRYPLAREHNIYAVSWMTNVGFCIERGIAALQSGQTAYASKLRFGSRLVPSVIAFRHRRASLQWILRSLSPWLAFDRFDPDLAALPKLHTERQAA